MEVDIEIDGLTNCLVNRITGEEMPDSRLTEPSDGKVYRLCEAILLSKRLGRPLTQDEMEQFVI